MVLCNQIPTQKSIGIDSVFVVVKFGRKKSIFWPQCTQKARKEVDK